MCGRFTLRTDPYTLKIDFPEFDFPEEMEARYNIAPSQEVAAVANRGDHRVELFQWGLIPSWAKDPAIGNRMINARAESLAEKPAFQRAYRKRRCLILADGFYEWKQEEGRKGKTPMYIQMRSGEPFAFGGLWEVWHPEGDPPVHSCTIITTSPNEVIEPIHNRMPLILERRHYALWLDPEEQSSDRLNPLLKPYPPESMAAFPVSRLVNDPKNNLEACILPEGRSFS
ncbi:MAG: SOS response-associated peptidase [Armatimonadetes bacterium]|nr:SOS response-associated peptidase [Armatimonadota bacterium]